MINPFAALFERKSISSPHDLLTYLSQGIRSSSGSTVNETTAMSVMAVLTCVSLRSRALASLPVRVYERIDDRQKQPASANHPIAKLLTKPNGWQTRAELFGMLEAHRVLRGNAYAWKNIALVPSGDGKLRPTTIELIPMHPDKVEVVETRDLTGPTGYRYHVSTGVPIDMAPEEVLHLKGLSTDGRKGRSVLADMREAIGAAIATQDHSSSLWSRDATPSVALKHQKTLSAPARRNLEESWEATYGRGADKRRVAVLEEGMEIQQLSLTPEDGQFLETRKFTRGEIAGAMHVPPHMIGDTEKSTSWGTGIEQQQIGFLVFTLRPDLVVWEQRLTRDLIRAESGERYFIEFNVNGFLRGDSAARGQWYRTMREIGVYNANEIRAFENENPVEGGDIYLSPSNLAPLVPAR